MNANIKIDIFFTGKIVSLKQAKMENSKKIVLSEASKMWRELRAAEDEFYRLEKHLHGMYYEDYGWVCHDRLEELKCEIELCRNELVLLGEEVD